MRLLLLVALASSACNKAPAGKPCERGAKIELRLVDNDSEYMKALFRKVGMTRDGSPTDPGAIDAGIRADIDQWSTDILNADKLPVETKRETDYYIHADSRSALEQYLGSVEAPPADHEIRLEHAEKWWRTYYVVKIPVLDTSAIADVRIDKNKVTEQPALMFTLTSAGQQIFAKNTAATVGKKEAFLVDEEIMSAPVINSAIKGGRFGLNIPDHARAETLLAKFQCMK